jgi:hypothetical protein
MKKRMVINSKDPAGNTKLNNRNKKISKYDPHDTPEVESHAKRVVYIL